MNAKHLRLKSAQNQLVSACGSVDDIMEAHPGLGRTMLFKWKDIDDKALMPLDVVLRLEEMCRSPIVTKALAEIAGCKLADSDPEVAGNASVMVRHADAIMQASQLMSVGAAAFADGKVTPNEASAIDRAAALLEDGLAEYRKALAGVRASGGLKVVGGGA